MNLNDFIPESYIPAIITSSVALTAAILAQFLNNWLTYRRENKKYKKEIYEKFISEYLMDILAYPSEVTRLIDDQWVNEQIDISKNLDQMFKKIHYGDKRLQSAFLSYKTFIYLDDVSPSNYKDLEKYSQFKICYYFLLYCRKIFNDLNFKLEFTVDNHLTYATKEYALLYIYTSEKSYDEAKNMLISIRRFYLSTLLNISLKEFEKCNNAKVVKKVDKELEKYMANL